MTVGVNELAPVFPPVFGQVYPPVFPPVFGQVYPPVFPPVFGQVDPPVLGQVDPPVLGQVDPPVFQGGLVGLMGSCPLKSLGEPRKPSPAS